MPRRSDSVTRADPGSLTIHAKNNGRRGRPYGNWGRSSGRTGLGAIQLRLTDKVSP